MNLFWHKDREGGLFWKKERTKRREACGLMGWKNATLILFQQWKVAKATLPYQGIQPGETKIQTWDILCLEWEHSGVIRETFLQPLHWGCERKNERYVIFKPTILHFSELPFFIVFSDNFSILVINTFKLRHSMLLLELPESIKVEICRVAFVSLLPQNLFLVYLFHDFIRTIYL